MSTTKPPAPARASSVVSPAAIAAAVGARSVKKFKIGQFSPKSLKLILGQRGEFRTFTVHDTVQFWKIQERRITECNFLPKVNNIHDAANMARLR